MSEDAGNDKTAEALRERIVAALKTVFDPEIPVSIYDLGLIYDLKVGESGDVSIRMTLTTPACPVAELLPTQVEAKVKAVDGVSDAKVEIVWDPPWTPERMSEAARLQLNLDFGSFPQPGGSDNITKLGRI